MTGKDYVALYQLKTVFGTVTDKYIDKDFYDVYEDKKDGKQYRVHRRKIFYIGLDDIPEIIPLENFIGSYDRHQQFNYMREILFK